MATYLFFLEINLLSRKNTNSSKFRTENGRKNYLFVCLNYLGFV